MEFDAFLLDQCARYPGLQAQDLVKAMYQGEFGCGHLVTQQGLAWLEEELNACRMPANPPPLVEPLRGGFCRVHLQALAGSGLSSRTLFRMFELSAAQPAGSMEAFDQQLMQLEQMASSGALPLKAADVQAFVADYRKAGCPATHHSQVFRSLYRPAYRVIRAEYARFLNVFAAIDSKLPHRHPLLVAIEGGSTSGKTTLAALLAQVYDANVFHMDDFFLRAHQRTPGRLAQFGGNVDYERFLQEVLEPLRARQPVAFRRFDCTTMTLSAPVQMPFKQLNIIEGVYSMRPTLACFYDVSVFLGIDPHTQAARVLARNGPAMQQRYLNEWIPMENRYFDFYQIASLCDIRIDGENGQAS
ncbi:MAG: uridine kinase family protein [Christensenellales bacterium]|jgi:uridine kinase